MGLCRSSELIPSFMKRYPIFLTFTDTIKLGTKLLKMWLKCDQNVTNPFPKKRFPQKAENICIIKIILYNFGGLNFVKIRHKRMAEVSITASRTLAYCHVKPVETPTYSHSKPRSQRRRKCTHKFMAQIHQSYGQKLTPCFNGMLRIL